MSMQQVYQVPEIAAPFIGRILDGDGHMYMDPQTLREIAGPLDPGHMHDFLTDYMQRDSYREDREKNRSELWNIKGIGAMGALDAAERLEALDLMGLRSQLIYYNTGSGEVRIDSADAREACRRYNDYGLAWQRDTGGRARVAMQINMSDPEWAKQEAMRVIKAGAKVVSLPSAVPPGGVSPAHELWDPFWGLLEEANVVATLHLGSGGLLDNKSRDVLTAEGDYMFPDRAWAEAPSLRARPADRPGGEEAISPYFILVSHMSAELYLTTLIMGHVFDRFPRLRFGVIEMGAAWLGPLIERMDVWADFMAKVGRTYSLKPSEFVARNIRVTPFWNENLARMIERHGLEDAYIFSTDYPHLEGSRDPLGKFSKYLEHLPKEYAQKFFIDNAQLLFPDL